MIVLQPTNKCIASTVCSIILVMLATILFFIQFGLVASCLLFFLSMAMLIPFGIAIGRTIVMEPLGCVIKLGPYSKTYSWCDFHTIRIEGPHLGMRLPYHKGGMFFSVRPTKKPLWFDPVMYTSMVHPISSFTVFFVTNKNNIGTPGYYECDKQMIVKQLDLWGVPYTNA